MRHGEFTRRFALAAVGLLSVSLAAFAGDGVPDAVKNSPSTHKQTAIISAVEPGEAAKLEDFCLAADGSVLALVVANPGVRTAGGTIRSTSLIGALARAVVSGSATNSIVDEDESGESTAVAETASKPAAGKPAAKGDAKAAIDGSEVRVFNAAGKQLRKWSVGFVAQAINVAPDGAVLVGGNGKVARFDAQGKKLHEAASPQMEYIKKNVEEMRERAKEQLESQKAAAKQQMDAFKEQAKALDEKKAEDLTPQEKSRAKQLFAAQIRSMEAWAKNLESKTVDQAIKEVTDRALKTHSICASDKDVFVVTPAMAGYGFAVWRTDAALGQPKEVVKSLSGCCGQMDVQCREGVLFVSENSRHRVVRFDRDGKEVGTFGKRDREGEGENFGGCCNPMNCCFNASGDLYVAESNGVVKHFKPDGTFVGLVGVAKVQPGCKNSCVATTADDSHLFYIDIYNSKIIVLTKQASSEKSAEKPAATKPAAAAPAGEKPTAS